MINWDIALKDFVFDKKFIDVVFLDEIQFMDTEKTLKNVEIILNNGIDVVWLDLIKTLEVSHGRLPQCCLGYQIK